MLCIEKMKARVRHHTPLAMIAGSKGLVKLYGLVGRDQEGHKQGNDKFNRTILVWRLEVKDVQQYVVLRRVTLQERITAMTLSLCNNWLFTGTSHGVLQVWDVSDNDSDAAKPSLAIGLTSCQASAGANGNSGVATIEVSGGAQAQSDFFEAVIMTWGTGGGAVYHWRFVTFAEATIDSASSFCPALELLGRYAPAKEMTSPTKSVCREKGHSDRALTTTPICVEIDTGSNVESMVLVLRGDLIHVLKIQARLMEVCAWPDYDNVVCIRQTALNATQGFLCLNQSFSSSVRVFTASPDQRSQAFQQSLLDTSSADGASRISVVETVALSKSPETFIVGGWTSGQVEIYALSRNERVSLLQDQHLNASITALTVCSDVVPVVTDGSATVAPSPGGRYRENKARSSRRMVVFFVAVGVEDGSMFGWEAKDTIAPTASNKPLSSRLMLAATSSVAGAHATHIAQLQRLVYGQSDTLLCSLGADASVKVWQAPSLTMVAYLNATPSSYASMVPSCLDVVYRNASPAATEPDTFLAIAYDDGTIAVWAIPSDKLAFSERPVSSSHGRRVTRICGVQSRTESPEVTLAPLFLSSSLDMTVVMWAILEERVEERKYFDVRAPVVDFCVLGAQEFLAFAHEVCVLNLAGSVMQSNKYFGCNSAQSARQPTPTMRSDLKEDHRIQSADVVDARTTEHPRRSSTPPDSRPPHAHDYLSVSIPSAARREPNVQSTAQTVDETIDTDVTMTLNPLIGWQSENEPEVQLGDEERRGDVRAKLFEFIDRMGLNRSVVAESLADFVFEVAEPPLSRKWVRTALLTRVRQLHVEPKGIVDAETDLEIVLHVLSAPPSSADPPVAKLGKPASNAASKNTMMARRKTVAKPSRKAIISYNSMGEKSVRWVEVESPATTPISQPVYVAAPDISQQERSPMSVQVPSPHARDMATPNTGSVSPFSPSDDIGVGSIDASRTFERETELADTARPMSRTRRQRKKSVAECLGARTAAISFIGEPLVQHLKLSVGFHPLWSSDYCWCRPAMPPIVVDTSNGKEGEGVRTRRCSDCGKRLHTVELLAAGYRPHFSVRAILEIICDVYTKLSTNAHAQLFKKSTSGKKTSDASAKSEPVTVFGALISVIKSRYGMQDVVELKVKQLLVSMCHFTRAVDAIAVFGEFLAMHVSTDSSLDEHVPHELVALCVCCYSWLYSREMVTAGNAVVGNGSRDSRHDASRSCDTSCGRDHWQFVPLSCALLCAQENLMYPLVNPGFLRNILTFMDEYAQETRWLPAIAIDGEDESVVEAQQRLSTVSTRWIEVHRFLRLIVGEWRQQNESFRVAERVLFLQCNDWADVDAEIVEKLRLILSCLVFYDHDRVGVMSIADFQNILRRLRYLWPNEHMTEAEAAETMEVSITYENAVRAACTFFADRERDGQLCYLDFWAMLYVVGMKTRSMIKFREIPSFCRDYKLEVAPQLSEVVLCFMERSCTVLLPQGLLLGKSSFDQKATRQHVRRVGGLHDGTFDLNKALTVSLSATTLIASTNGLRAAAHAELFVEPAALVLRQSASVSAVDRFRPVSSQDSGEDERYREYTRNERRVASQKKEPTLLRVSSLGLEGTQALLPRELEHQSSETTRKQSESPKKRPKPAMPAENAHEQGPEAASNDRGHLYIQFHDVMPRRIRPRRPTVTAKAAHDVGDDESVETSDSVLNIELHDTPTIEVVVGAPAGADVDVEEEDNSVDAVGADTEEEIIPESAPRSPGYRDPEWREVDSPAAQLDFARDHTPLQCRRSSTTIVRVPSVGKEISSSSSSLSGAAISPAVTPVRERSPQRGDRHRSASMTAIAISALQEKTQPSVAAASQSPSTREPSARVVVSDVDAQNFDGAAVSPTKGIHESSLPPSTILIDDSINATELTHTQGGESEREAQILELNNGNESNRSEGTSENDVGSGNDNRLVSEDSGDDGEGGEDGVMQYDQHAGLAGLATEREGNGHQGSAESTSEGLLQPVLAVATEYVGLLDNKSAQPRESEVTAVGEPRQQTTAADSNLIHEGVSTASTTKSDAVPSTAKVPTGVPSTDTEVSIAHTTDLPGITSPTTEPSNQHIDQATKELASSVLPQERPKLTEIKPAEAMNSSSSVNPDLHKEDASIAASEASDRPSTAQSNHTFRFSQQPNFRSGAQSFNNPFRSAQWSPRNDSGSESGERKLLTAMRLRSGSSFVESTERATTKRMKTSTTWSCGSRRRLAAESTHRHA